jgi:hypothetical protein
MPTTTLFAPAALLAALALAVPAAAQPGRVDARTPAAANATVEVSVRGTVRVSGWSRNEVHVTGTVDSGDAVVLDGSGRSIEVRLRGQRGRGGTATLEIRVPAGSSVEVNGGSGSIHVAGITGSVEANNRGGSTTVTGAPRRIEVNSAGGTVSVDARTGSLEISAMGGGVWVAGSVRDRTEVNAVGGSVELVGTVNDVEVNSMGGPVRIASAGGRVEVTAVSGDVQVSGSRLRGSVQNVSGNVTVTATGPLAGALSLDSHSGNVELRLPARAGATVNVTTFSGGFLSEVDGQTRREGQRQRQVVVGGGGPAVSISTFSGNVKLTRP